MGFFNKVKNALGSKKEDVESQNKDENIVNDEKDDGTDFVQEAQRQEIELSPHNILFVCTTNTTISPMAEAIFNQFSEDLQAFSAGLMAQRGNRASQDAIRVCQKHGIELSDHLTANINDFSLDDVGLILTSTAHIRDGLKMKFPDARIFTIKEYAGGYSDLDISDPFDEGLAGHVVCFMEINETVIKILRKDMGGQAEEIVERPVAIGDENIVEKPIKINNFKYLDDLIHSGAKEIVLDSDIVLSDGEESEYGDGIKLDIDDLVIDGNGHAIDAKEKTRIFYCTGKNIEIKNIILKNGFNESRGGAIYNDHVALTVRDLKFLKNHATYGGAIFNNIGDVIINESTFEDNEVDFDGGAIFNEASAIYQGKGGIIKVENSFFIGNRAKDGGAIYSNLNSETFLFNCNLEDNVAGRGGAIRNIAWLSIRGCSLNSNSSSDVGGAVHSVNILEVRDSIFEANNAHEGGAIFNERNLSIKDSNLVNNDAECGGAIFNASSVKGRIGNANIMNCIISNNSAGDGGAIFNKDDTLIDSCIISENQTDGSVLNNLSNSMKISSTKFTENSSGNGHVIYNDGFLSLKDIIFDEEHSVFNENKIIVDSNDYDIKGNGKSYDAFPLDDNQNDFKHLDILIRNGGEIKLETDIILDLYNDEELEFSQGIEIEENDVCIDGCNHIIDAKGKSRIFNVKAGSLTLKNIIIKNAFGDVGGAVKNFEGKVELINSKIIDCEASQDGGAIHSRGGELLIEESQILTNRSRFSGGGIDVFKGNVTIKNSVFEGNVSESSGGAIFMRLDSHDNTDGHLKCSNSTFKNNYAELGGAIKIEAQMELYRCDFSNNCCSKNGSSIYQGNNSQISSLIEYSTFRNDLEAQHEAIYIFTGHSTIKDNKFEFMHPFKDYVIVNDSSMRLTGPKFQYDGIEAVEKHVLSNGVLKIFKSDGIEKYIESAENCEMTFLDDYDTRGHKTFGELDSLLNQGGCEITLDDDFVMFEFEQEFFEGGIDLDFENLILDGQGHCINADGLSRIFNVMGNVILKNITFKNGKTYQNKFGSELFGGGAINVIGNSSLKLINCRFIDNSSKNSAGAVINKGDLTIESCRFTNSFAETHGGAVYNCRNASLTIEMSDFESCESFSGGALDNNGSCEIFNSNLIKNTSKKGGAIYNTCKLESYKCIFEKNICSDVQIGKWWVGGYGGAIHSHDGVLHLKNDTYENNGSTDGGAIYTHSDDIIVEKSLFLRNFSERGGAINNDSDLEIVGCRFVGNVLRIMDDSSYTSNEQSFSSDLHGATFHNNRHIKLIDCDFPSIKSDVIDKWGDVTMVNCSFEDHETSDY